MSGSVDWTGREKLIARVISWGIMISIVIIITGGIWTVIELLIYPTSPDFEWFINLGDWTYQVLVIGGILVGVVVGIIVFSIFIRRGQRFILNLLFKIED
ncbi:MAG: hypothetical protein HWN65_20130 [Candidatus Helarchaeota archaeon]|nr:hypothetical protein [Candidatus Helarchaeota archaeon]